MRDKIQKIEKCARDWSEYSYVEYSVEGIQLAQFAAAGVTEVEDELILGFCVKGKQGNSDLEELIERNGIFDVYIRDTMMSEEDILKHTKKFIWGKLFDIILYAGDNIISHVEVLTKTLYTNNRVVSSNGTVHITTSSDHVIILTEAERKKILQKCVLHSEEQLQQLERVEQILKIDNIVLEYMALYELLYSMNGNSQKNTETYIEKRTEEIGIEGVKWKRTNGKMVEGSYITFLRNKIAHDIRALSVERYGTLEDGVRTYIGKLMRLVVGCIYERD